LSKWPGSTVVISTTFLSSDTKQNKVYKNALKYTRVLCYGNLCVCGDVISSFLALFRALKVTVRNEICETIIRERARAAPQAFVLRDTHFGAALSGAFRAFPVPPNGRKIVALFANLFLLDSCRCLLRFTRLLTAAI
jgi:hypothetical protein